MYQELTIVGHLGNTPEMRYTPNGKAVTNFSVAVNGYNTTVWFRVAAWERLAEICSEYLEKGSLVLVTGRLTADDTGSPRIWYDKEGTPHASYEMVALAVKFLGRPKATSKEGAQEEDTPF